MKPGKMDKWWEEYDFVFNEYFCTYYIWPSDRIICFGDYAFDAILVPTFDVRCLNNYSLENYIEDAVENFKSLQNVDDINSVNIYVSIIRYKENNHEIGVIVDEIKLTPTTIFCPTENRWIEGIRRRNDLPTTDGWGLTHPPRPKTDEELNRMEKRLIDNQKSVELLRNFELSVVGINNG